MKISWSQNEDFRQWAPPDPATWRSPLRWLRQNVFCKHLYIVCASRLVSECAVETRCRCHHCGAAVPAPDDSPMIDRETSRMLGEQERAARGETEF